MNDDSGLVYVGKIIEINEIPEVDFIAIATVICGNGGKWKGVIIKADFVLCDECVVFLPDSQLNENDYFYLDFMKKDNWRVKMRRFKGVNSEVLITQHFPQTITKPVGYDLTNILNVKKYHKPVPTHLAGKVKGEFGCVHFFDQFCRRLIATNIRPLPR